MRIFQSAEQRVVFEPVRVLLRERFESAAKSCVGGLRVALISAAQDLIFELVRFAEVDLVRGCDGRLRRRVKQAFFD